MALAVPDAVIPKERTTCLFSATMTSKVAKLQRASLQNPVKLEISSKYDTVETLQQYYMWLPMKHKDVYLTYLINETAGNTVIIFTATCNACSRLALLLRNLGFAATPLHGQMSQAKRLGSLASFKSNSRQVRAPPPTTPRRCDVGRCTR
jgi:ATP-dependent RNA helicase DDX47/RRP3